MKKLKFLRKFLQNFILCREIPGRSEIDFWLDYQQILKKHNKVFHENRISHWIILNKISIEFKFVEHRRKILNTLDYFLVKSELILSMEVK